MPMPDDRPMPVRGNMTYGQMRAACYPLQGLTVASALLPGDLMGAYCERTGTILVDRRLTYVQKRCVLAHELAHWRHGDEGCAGVASCMEESRARRETALLLVDPVRLMVAESMYGANLWAIAAELGVTLQVIGDYRSVIGGWTARGLVGRETVDCL